MAVPNLEILWVSLPNGVAAKTAAGGGGAVLRLSVLVSPRLDPGAMAPALSAFDAMFKDWPAIVRQAKFAVEFQPPAAGSVAARPLDYGATRVAPDPDSALWQGLFPPTLFVRPPDRGRCARLSRCQFHTFSMRHVAAYMKGVHQAIATAPHRHPTASHPAIAAMIATLRPVAVNSAGTYRAFVDAMASPGAVMVTSKHTPAALKLPAAVTNATLQFSRMRAHQTRAVSRAAAALRPGVAPTTPRKLPPPPNKPLLDFHQIVASLGDYPQLMRRLGLIVDLEVPLTPDLPAGGNLRIIPGLPAAGAGTAAPAHNTPWTVYVLDRGAGRFRAAGDPTIHEGLLDLGGVNDQLDLLAASPFEIVQFDVDGKVTKSINYSAQNHDPSGPAPLPALSSAGLSLVKADRHAGVQARLVQAAKAFGQGAPPAVHSEGDLLRGYRVDVLDETDPTVGWLSLCRRVGTYILHGKALDLPADEGYVKDASASSAYAQDPSTSDATVAIPTLAT